MKINKNSWHYKFLDNETKVFGERINVWFDDDYNYTLCEYVGRILNKIRNIGVMVLLYALLSVVVECMVLWLILFWLDLVVFYPLICVAGYFGWITLIALAIIFVTCFTVHHLGNVTKDNLLTGYLKAKKNKYCPIVEFVDE